MQTAPLKSVDMYDTIERQTHVSVDRCELERIERQLIPLLIAIQKALGKEPSVLTREAKRRNN